MDMYTVDVMSVCSECKYFRCKNHLNNCVCWLLHRVVSMEHTSCILFSSYRAEDPEDLPPDPQPLSDCSDVRCDLTDVVLVHRDVDSCE